MGGVEKCVGVPVKQEVNSKAELQFGSTEGIVLPGILGVLRAQLPCQSKTPRFMIGNRHDVGFDPLLILVVGPLINVLNSFVVSQHISNVTDRIVVTVRVKGVSQTWKGAIKKVKASSLSSMINSSSFNHEEESFWRCTR